MPHFIWGTPGFTGLGMSHGASRTGASVGHGNGGQVPGVHCGMLLKPGVTPGTHGGRHGDGPVNGHPPDSWAAVCRSGTGGCTGAVAHGRAGLCRADADSCPNMIFPARNIPAGT